jgi:hypothetical protein
MSDSAEQRVGIKFCEKFRETVAETYQVMQVLTYSMVQDII